MRLPEKKQLEAIYGESAKSGKRFQHLSTCFFEKYHPKTAEFFTAPGRTEIIGNHTDHNGGKVIAASIDMDTIGAACPNGSNVIRITSEGYKQEVVVDASAPEKTEKASTTAALVAGMVEGARKNGFQVSGFDAYVSTTVIAAAGVSSSASFEMLFCSIINYFFNDGAMTYSDYAKIGQYAENVYWKKASGMMDQMACAVGGAILLDFSDSKMPKYQKIDFSFQDFGYQPVIVNTGKGHADLSHEYSEVPEEMREVAKVLGVQRLNETTQDQVIAHCGEIPNDRAVLRALHFFGENERVEQMAKAVAKKDYHQILDLIQESGNSSWKYLQNCYSLQNCREQKVSLMLALSEVFCKEHGAGVCRVHGGGFAGVIVCIVPQEDMEAYTDYISQFVGRENVYPVNIRAVGAVHIPAQEA